MALQDTDGSPRWGCGWSGCRMLSGVNRRIFEGWDHFVAVDKLPTRLVVASLVHR
jgi:hypothetical protein